MAVQTYKPVLPATTAIGSVHLTVRDLDRSRAFYEQVLGMRASEGADATVALSAADGHELLVLHWDPSAAPLDHRRAGLYHFAVLVPSRRELAVALERVAQARWPLHGASDHLVSEALYLADPEGNGIEIYRDRPRAEWRTDASGQLEMATLPLDLDALLGELSDQPGPGPGLPAGTVIGHVHLQVADLRTVEEFYAGVLGFDVVVRGFPGALFVSAGGYHHHLGLNVWHSRGAEAPGAGAAGLRFYEVRVGDPAGLQELLARVAAAGLVSEPRGEGALVHDPSGNSVLVRM